MLVACTQSFPFRIAINAMRYNKTDRDCRYRSSASSNISTNSGTQFPMQ